MRRGCLRRCLPDVTGPFTSLTAGVQQIDEDDADRRAFDEHLRRHPSSDWHRWQRAGSAGHGSAARTERASTATEGAARSVETDRGLLNLLRFNSEVRRYRWRSHDRYTSAADRRRR